MRGYDFREGQQWPDARSQFASSMTVPSTSNNEMIVWCQIAYYLGRQMLPLKILSKHRTEAKFAAV